MSVQDLYSEKVMDHFFNPRNMGEIENPDAVARVGNPVCGDVMEMYIKVGTRDAAAGETRRVKADKPDGLGNAAAKRVQNDDLKNSESKKRMAVGSSRDTEKYIKDIKFKTLGCGAAIATSSIATEMVKGKSLEEAKEITNKAVSEALGGLPPVKTHCSVLAADAVKKAIRKYREGN